MLQKTAADQKFGLMNRNPGSGLEMRPRLTGYHVVRLYIYRYLLFLFLVTKQGTNDLSVFQSIVFEKDNCVQSLLVDFLNRLRFHNFDYLFNILVCCLLMQIKLFTIFFSLLRNI